MNRREALAATAALLGGSIIGSQVFLTGCVRAEKKVEGFDSDLLSLLDHIAETILPATASSPGAGSCKVGEFMQVIVTECYSPEDREILFHGIATLQQTAQKEFNNPFEKLTGEKREQLLDVFDRESQNTKVGDSPAHFFTMLHQLTLWGYFSSEAGATQALRYVPVPGRYEGCVPYKAGEPAWLY